MRCQFLPDYLVRRLAADTDRVRPSSAELTLRLDDELRSQRDAPPRTVRRKLAAAGPTRIVHDARQTEELPGVVVRKDGDPSTSDAAADEAFVSSGQVWDLFAQHFNRRSVDGNGSTVSITVHFGQAYDNAFWDGQQLVFGDGDGVLFERFTLPMDVLAHEFTHGVVQFTAGLAYQGQSGALNESISDVFAALTRQRWLDQTSDQADWLIGAGLFAPGVRARALRSMSEPGTAYDDPRLGRDPQVAAMADYVDTEEDSGGVHINSGIPNRAFALAARAIGGRSWEQPGHCWYEALTSGEVTSGSDFATFARATINAGLRLYPDDPRVVDAVRDAWAEVGVRQPDRGAVPVAAAAPTATAQLVAVSRTGGFTGVPRSGELDLDLDPAGPEVRELLTSVDLEGLTVGSASADRFVYTLEYGQHRVTLPEQDLTPELHRVVQIVLGRRQNPLTPS